MWIERIDIRNFRSYGSEPVEINTNKGLNILVGENNSGKSSMFAAILHLTQQRGGLDVGDRPYGEAAPFSINLTYRLHPDEGPQAFNVLTTGTAVPEAEHPGRQKFTGYLEETNFTVGWDGQQTLKAQIGPYSLQDASVMVGNSGPSFSLGQFLEEVSQRGSVEDALNVTNQINFGRPVSGEILSMFAPKLRVFSDVRARPIGQGGNEDYLARGSFDGTSTADFLFSLKNGGVKERAQYSSIQNRFASFFPGLKFDVTRETTNPPHIVFNRLQIGFDIPQENVGTGVLEILTLIANLEGRRGTVLVVEEPELHLHPHSQRELLTLLKQSSEHNQIFVLTHSPFFIDPGNPESIHRVWIGEEGTKVTAFPTNLTPRERAGLIERMRDPGQREMLFARGVLLVEGETERAFLSTIGALTGYDLDTKAVSIISVDGEDDYMPYIRLFNAWNIPFLCHRDNGPGGSAPQYADRFRYIGAEFEEYMASEGFAELLNEARMEVGNNKPRIGRYLGSHIQPQQIPEKFLDLLREATEMVG